MNDWKFIAWLWIFIALVTGNAVAGFQRSQIIEQNQQSIELLKERK